MKSRALAALVATLSAQAAVAQAPSSIAGRWKTEDNVAIVTFAPCANGIPGYCGHVTQFLITEPKGGVRDSKNPDARLRDRPVLGKAVFTGLTASARSWKGRGYSVKDGRHFNATLTANGRLLTVRGCVSIICRTVEWTRA